MSESVRPTKKQRELLDFIEKFIAMHGYGPSYREIMQGLNYTSVATVATHVNNLIARGHLSKKDRSARSLEIVDNVEIKEPPIKSRINPTEEKWLVDKVEQRFAKAESGQIDQTELDGLYVLVGSLKVLGLNEAAQSFIPRLSEIKKKI